MNQQDKQDPSDKQEPILFKTKYMKNKEKKWERKRQRQEDIKDMLQLCKYIE